MMPASAGAPALAGVPFSSPAAGLPEAGEQAGGQFIGVLQGMTAQKAPQGAVGPAAGKDATASEKEDEATAATAVQDGMSGLMAGLLSALEMTAKPQAAGTVPDVAVPTAGASDTKSQDVALDADGVQSALLVQMSGSRMLQADGTTAQQTLAALVAEVGTTTGAARSVVALQMDGSRMLQADGTTAQQTLAALMQEISAATDGDGTPATPAAGVDGGQKPAGNETAATADQAVLAKESLLQGLAALVGVSRQEASVTEPVAVQPVVMAAEQNTLTVTAGAVSTERGQAPSEQKRSAGEAAFSRAGSSSTPGTVSAEVMAVHSSPAPVNGEQQQAVILPRSASLEAALAGDPAQKDGSTAELAQTASPAPVAQNAQTAGTLPASAGKAPLNTRLEEAALVDPATVSPDGHLPDQAAAITDTRTSRMGEGTRSIQAGVVSEAGKKSAELGGDTLQTRVERGVVAKAVESAVNDVAQSAGDAPTGDEFSGGEQGAADQFTNGQVHTTPAHQQGKIEGVSVASTNSVATPVQTNGQRSELSDQIMQQVKDRLVNHEVKTGTDQIVLKLSPENLGDLKVNLSMDGQRLKVEIVAENRMVRDALLQNTDSLKESLARQNISMESFDVTTGGRGAGNPGQGQQQDAWREFAQQKQQNAWLASGGYRLPDAAATAAASRLAYQAPSQHTMVDLHF
ncbi:flagellar hook-length control protein FliK [Geobacter sp. FeAm09]|uniref:flagellar hook-length control protein FliK n=1 Tax=Geobacter sp. FeAm09 TaxID=2597769 RepID=UPI00143DC8BE|nr:flagellar hook-length control protein FliK [Geobacter sp. FeAm09]